MIVAGQDPFQTSTTRGRNGNVLLSLPMGIGNGLILKRGSEGIISTVEQAVSNVYHAANEGSRLYPSRS